MWARDIRSAYRLAFLINACSECRRRRHWRHNCDKCGGPTASGHVSRNHLANWLAGKADITAQRLAYVFDALGMTITIEKVNNYER